MQKSVEGMLRSLIYQLLTSCEEMISCFPASQTSMYTTYILTKYLGWPPANLDTDASSEVFGMHAIADRHTACNKPIH